MRAGGRDRVRHPAGAAVIGLVVFLTTSAAGLAAASPADQAAPPADAALSGDGAAPTDAPAPNAPEQATAADPTQAGPHWVSATRPPVWAVLREQFGPPPGPPALPELPPLGAPHARVTLREAVATALQNNPGLIAQSLTPVVQEQGILQAQARFDPVFGAQTDYDHRVTPATSALVGADTSDVSSFNWNFFAAKGLLSGANLRVDFLNNRYLSNSDFQGLSPQYKPEAVISLNQPLLRDFGFYFTRLRLQIAETATEAAVEDYRAAVSNFIARVVRTYWEVVLFTEQLRVKQESLELAQQTVRDNRTRVDVGVLPPVAIKESEAEAARREEDVIVAENRLFQARRVLQALVYMPGYNDWLPRPVEPVDQPTTEKVDLDLEKALQMAVTRRGEVRSARMAVEGSELSVAFYKNQTMPKLEVFGSYGVNALAGDPTRKVDPLDFKSIYGGTYGDALGRLVSNNFYDYGGGIRLEVPLANAGRDADYTRSRVEREQSLAVYRQRVSDVTLEVSQSWGDVQSGMKRIEATRVARELAEENLRNQTKRYEVGMVTTTDLLKFQNEVTATRLSENLALIDYNNSLAALERAKGTLPDRFNVEVAPRRSTYTPWWARF